VPRFQTATREVEEAPPEVPAEPPTLEALVAAHFRFVWRLVRRLGVIDPDDAAQEVFLVAMRRLADIETGRERAFLGGVATRVASQARRTQARRRQADVPAPDVASIEPSPAEHVAAGEARALLDEILADMPLELRAVFVLFELEGVSMAEIAAALEIPPGTVASRLARARTHFHAGARRVQRGGR
jgi:RNA polymerase sigma-70 factor, ECF subfamily